MIPTVHGFLSFHRPSISSPSRLCRHIIYINMNLTWHEIGRGSASSCIEPIVVICISLRRQATLSNGTMRGGIEKVKIVEGNEKKNGNKEEKLYHRLRFTFLSRQYRPCFFFSVLFFRTLYYNTFEFLIWWRASVFTWIWCVHVNGSGSMQYFKLIIMGIILLRCWQTCRRQWWWGWWFVLCVCWHTYGYI